MEEDIKILENFFEDRMDVEEEKWALERILKTFRLLNSKLIHLSDEEYRNVIELAQKDSIPKAKIEEQIKWLDNDIKNTKNKLEEGKRPYPNYIGEHRRLRMKAFITKSKEIKQRLQDLLREE